MKTFLVKKYNFIQLLITMNFLLKIFHSKSKSPCGIDKIKIPKRTLIKQERENFRILRENNWEPIRIHFDYSYLENGIGTTINKSDLIDLKEKIMPKTKEIFENLLKVKRIQNKLMLNSPNCETFPIPDIYNHGGGGVEADIVIFVLVDNSGYFQENGIEAAAIHCLQHQETRRPIAGYIQFKQYLNVTDSTILDYYVWLAVHELTHVLVINKGLYEDYINPETLVPLGYDRVIGSKIIDNGKKMNFIKTPNVLNLAKKHFGCSHLDGLPLEYNGGVGTAGSHWSKRYMNTDYMIGESYGENLISDITLALFSDSGWYSIDYSLSNLFIWGKGKGCAFFDRKKKCIFPVEENSKIKNITNKDISNENLPKNLLKKNEKNFNHEKINKKKKKFPEFKTKFKNEFCVEFNHPVCSTSNLFRGKCELEEHSEPLNKFQKFFKNPRIGGSDSLTDRCPIASEQKENQFFYSGSCKHGEKFNSTLSIEKICPECACFMSNLREEEKNITKNFRINYLPEKISEIKTEKVLEKITIFARKKNEIYYNFKELPFNLGKNKTNHEEYEFIDMNPIYEEEDFMASCFEFVCEESDLFVKINNNKFKCEEDREITNIPGYKGGIKCPDKNVLCDYKFNCKFGCTSRYNNNISYKKFDI